MRFLCLALSAAMALFAFESAIAPAQDNSAAPSKTWEELVGADEAAVGKLRELQTKYRTADTDSKIKIIEEYEQTIRQLRNEILPALEAQLPEKLKTAQDDLKAQRIASQVLQYVFDDNRYGQARQLADDILKLKADNPHALNLSGICRFADHDFEGAVKTLSLAKENGVLDEEMGAMYLQMGQSYIDYWKKEQEIRTREEAAPEAEQLPRVKLETTRGEIVVELFENEAPNTVANFINLVEKKYYDGLKFHRVIPGFMAQGGCPNSRDGSTGQPGTGGPGYNIACECYRPDARRHFAGSLSMAHAGKDTGGSQFFITHLPTPHLDKEVNPQSVHTVFGRVIQGLDVVRALEVDDTIKTATVLRKRNHEYVPVTQPE